MPSFADRNRKKQVEPVETRRIIGNDRDTLIGRVLAALEQKTENANDANIVAPVQQDERTSFINRVLARLNGEADPAKVAATGYESVGKSGDGLIERMADATAKLINKRDDLAREINNAVAGKTKRLQRSDIETDVETLLADYRAKFRRLAEQLIAGDITHASFRYEMGKAIKSQQTQAAIIGSGGQANMTDNHRRLLDRSIKDQLGYLDGFHRDIRKALNAGNKLPARMVSRAGSYADAASATAEQSRRQSMAEEAATETPDLWEVRILGAAEHCNDCVRFAFKPGPIGSLPPIGDSECGNKCKCRFEYGTRDELLAKYGRGSSE